VVCAVLSSNFDFPIPSDFCFAGEVGLSGEVRPVPQVDRRISEAGRLGFSKIYVSSFSAFERNPADIGSAVGSGSVSVAGIVRSHIEVVRVPDIPALVRTLFK
jgi:DNA repair protein RadA/Sms